MNGALVATLPGAIARFRLRAADGAARGAAAARRANMLAIHVQQTRGGQFIDAGIVEVIEKGIAET